MPQIVYYPPPAKVPRVLTQSKQAYSKWHLHLEHIRKIDRFTIGVKIDSEFQDLLEALFQGTFAYDKFEKLSLVGKAIAKTDILKFFLQIAWEQKVIPHKFYASLIIDLDEIGRMLGGWKKSLQEKTPTSR